MFVVIFRAEFKRQDSVYLETAEKMRELAMNKYGCLKFTSLSEGNAEITLSYWHSEDDIRRWKQNLEHLEAQDNGKQQWYSWYCVEIAEIKRTYEYPS